MDQQGIADLKRQFIRKLEQVNRVGVSDLIKWLQQTDFFEAPCSARHHLNRPGGLVAHSLNVYQLLSDKIMRLCPSVMKDDENTGLICGLLHDLCKVGMYTEDVEELTPAQDYKLKQILSPSAYTKCRAQFITKAWASDLINHRINKKEGDLPKKTVAYKINDKFPFGHGEKSVSLIQDFIRLTEEEKLAIRYHMSAFEQGLNLQTYNVATERTPLVVLLFTSDFEATHIVEQEGGWRINIKE